MPDQAALQAWINSKQKKRWDAATTEKKAEVWKINWENTPLYIYNDIIKAEAMALFLFYIEILGLNY